jgi:hypothetical protein
MPVNHFIKLNNQTEIDLPKLIESKLLVQANSGGGKSWALRRILEQSHGKVQHIILDSEGEFATLREKYDYVLAGKGGDTPAEPRSAALLARKLLELKVSAIIDLYELHPQERKRFVRLFLESLINAPKDLWHDCIVVIDEAHTYAPEKGQSEAMDAVIGLCALGRKRGFSAILATQRISKLSKDAAAECNNKLIGRASQDIDMKRAADELGFTSREQMLSLRALKPGEFYAFGPAISDEVQKVTVGDVHTTHPKVGSRSLTKVVPPTDGIKKILGKLADLPQEAEKEAKTVDELRLRIVTLQREKSILEKAPGANPVAIEAAVSKQVETVRKEIERNANQEIQKERDEQTKTNREWQVLLNAWIKYAEDLKKVITALGPIITKVEGVSSPESMALELPTKQKLSISSPVARPPASATASPHRVEPATSAFDSGLTGPEQRVLNALAWCESIGNQKPPNELVAFLSGYSHFRSTGYTNPRGYLKSKGLIEYSAGSVYLTEEGRPLASSPDVPLTEEALHQAVLAKLDGPERKLLSPLLETYPEGISNVDLCAMAGYMHERSTGYTNPRGRLKSFGLIDYDSGKVKAKSLLFL